MVGGGRHAGNGTRFEILDSINEDPEIEGANDEERTMCDNPINNSMMHGKERGKNGKTGGDKKGKTADNKATRAPTKNIPLKKGTGGTPAVNNIQILKRTNKEDLTRNENQGTVEASQRHDGPGDQQALIGQSLHATHERVTRDNNSHAGTHHLTRPPDCVTLGQDVDHNTVGPNTNVGNLQEQRIDEEDMEIVPETPNPDQSEGGVKNMVLS
jgi:hypothetical protein